MKVLIVEDDLILADTYSDMLHEFDTFSVCCIARTIREAVRCAGEHDPDLALVDVRLARGEFGTAIPGLLKPEIGILYSTGNPERLHVDGIRGHGCLTKPFSSNDLWQGLRFVSELMSKGRSLKPPSGNFLLLPEGAQRLAV